MADGKADYDVSVIDVSPSGMHTTASQLVDLALAVSDSLKSIDATVSTLRVAWQGKAATDAEDLNHEWIRVMTELFGTKDDPKQGVLPTLADGVGMAAANFTLAEVGIKDLFTHFTDATSGSGGSDKPPNDNDHPKAVTDTNQTAVTMTFPT